MVDADKYQERKKKNSYLADGEWAVWMRADECVGVQMRGCADAWVCRCVGVQMRWHADVWA